MLKSEQMYSKLTITLVIVGSALLAWFFKWQNDIPNLMDGDAKDYYSALVSLFIQHDLSHQNAQDWYLLHTSSGIINVHPVGVALLQLPFFLGALLIAPFTGFSADGYSLPFQIAVAMAALFYVVVGLNFLRRLLLLQGFQDRIIAAVIVLVYFGTNLMHYTLSEAGMSHVYSFALLCAFLYYTASFYQLRKNATLLKTGIVLGLILLVRPNNIFILPAAFLWCQSVHDFKSLLSVLFRRPAFYGALGLTLMITTLQSLVWYLQTGSFFHNTYKRDGFYWLKPQITEFLFGFDGGFFIYTPLCLLLMTGLFVVFKKQRFQFALLMGLFSLLFYFFSSYWAYTYFDGFGIRVMVDYYGLIGLLAAHLFSAVSSKFYVTGTLAVLLLILNLVYTLQVNTGIILRSGMNFKMWSYVFLKTAPQYRYCLGGSHELKPYSATSPALMDTFNAPLQTAFDFTGKEFGPAAASKMLAVKTRRIFAELNCSRREKVTGASMAALLVVSVTRSQSDKAPFYAQFPLNETPAADCCETEEYKYTCNLVGEFERGDQVNCYIWNRSKAPFLLEKLSLKLYNYNYELN